MVSEFGYDICPWTDIVVTLRCLSIGKIDVITYKYVTYTHTSIAQVMTLTSWSKCDLVWKVFEYWYTTAISNPMEILKTFFVNT